MLDFNTDHPSFDLDMELLCSLPTDPGGAPLIMLCEDFGLHGTADVLQTIERLRARGYDIVTCNHNGYRSARISGVGFKHVRSDAQRYWELVNELQAA